MIAAPSPERQPASARDVVEMLRRHYLPDGRPAGGILAAEIEAPDNLRRADALWAPFTIAGGDGLIGHEVKVSRSDVLAELADPTKAESWGRYCTQWWLTVSDPALIAGMDIPEAWGVMAPPSGRRTRTMTVLRPAPKRKVGDTGSAWRRVMAWEHHRNAALIGDLTREVHSLERTSDDRHAEVVRLRLSGEAGRDPNAAKVALVLREVYRISTERASWLWIDVNPVDVAAALVNLATVRDEAKNMRWDLDRLIHAAEDAVAPFGRAKKRLAQLRDDSATLFGTVSR